MLKLGELLAAEAPAHAALEVAAELVEGSEHAVALLEAAGELKRVVELSEGTQAAAELRQLRLLLVAEARRRTTADPGVRAEAGGRARYLSIDTAASPPSAQGGAARRGGGAGHRHRHHREGGEGEGEGEGEGDDDDDDDGGKASA
eukprot:scaffold3749_cov457-Prasinococcus_capsulatus_cf.AAC.8